MKAMKKLASLALALILALALAVPAMAVGYTPAETVTVVFNGDPVSLFATTTPAYNGYKLMNLTISLKCGDETHEHTDECYNYAYTLNTKYAEIMVTAANSCDINDSKGSDVTDNTLVAALATLTGEDDEDTVRNFANAVYRAILEGKLAADISNIQTFEETTITQGYWLFADVTEYSEDETDTIYSLVLLDTKKTDADPITVNPKKELPTVTKTVDDPDFDLGEKITFTLTGTVDENLASYESYTYIFHDTLSSGLTLDEDSFEVKLDNTTLTKDKDYKVTISGTKDGCSFEVSILNMLELGNISADSEITVTYNAVLNEKALNTDVETNTVYLEYSNNPYDEDATGKTPDKTVYVYDFDIVIDKYADGNESKKLANAEFVLKNEAGKYYKLENNVVSWVDTQDAATTVTTNTSGIAEFKGLDSGKYQLIETKAPAGYNLLEKPIAVEITATYRENDGTLVSSSATSTNNGQYSQTQKVANNSGTVLPETGGIGTTIFYIVGGILVLGAVVLLITKKRMSAEK